MPPTAEITYTDAVGSVIRETLPAAEDDEGIPFVLIRFSRYVIYVYILKYFYLFFVSYTFVY